MVVRGFGIGMSMMPAMTAAYATLRPEQVNDAAPQLNVLQRVGGSIGTAILTVVLQNGITAQHAGRRSPPRFAHTYWWVVGVSVVALLPTILLAVIERAASAPALTHSASCADRHEPKSCGPRSASCSPPSAACAGATRTARASSRPRRSARCSSSSTARSAPRESWPSAPISPRPR